MFVFITVSFIVAVVATIMKFRPRGAKRGYEDMTRDGISLLIQNDQNADTEPSTST